jgi:uncharacterized protein
MNRRTFIRRAVTTALAATAGGTAMTYARDTHAIEKCRVPLTLGLNLPLRVAVMGDIHFDPLYEEAYIAATVTEINGLHPDLILYTGDFITNQSRRVHDLAAILSLGTARLGAYAVPGNHDHWAGLAGITSALEKKGIRFLRNKCVALPDEDQVFLSGLDSFWAGTPDPSVLAATPENSRHILLVHEPDSFLQVTDPRVKLQISGHTHGGQVRLPFYGALVLPRFGRNFEMGLYKQESRSLYVNRGIGTLLPHVRLNCAPEITVFELT